MNNVKQCFFHHRSEELILHSWIRMRSYALYYNQCEYTGYNLFFCKTTHMKATNKVIMNLCLGHSFIKEIDLNFRPANCQKITQRRALSSCVKY